MHFTMSAMSTARSEVMSIFEKTWIFSEIRTTRSNHRDLTKGCFCCSSNRIWEESLFPVFASTIDRLFPEEANSIIIVVTPLTAIMKDQVRK